MENDTSRVLELKLFAEKFENGQFVLSKTENELSSIPQVPCSFHGNINDVNHSGDQSSEYFLFCHESDSARPKECHQKLMFFNLQRASSQSPIYMHFSNYLIGSRHHICCIIKCSNSLKRED